MSWRKAYLESRVLSADPVELIAILYEYAILSVQDARHSLIQGDIKARSKAISKVIAILGELERSLDYELGGEIASNLARLYRYMRERLTQANLKQVDGPLAEAEALLKTLGEAWQAVKEDKEKMKDEAYASQTPANWQAPPAMDLMSDYSAHSWSV